jgi:hypothetical protein
VIIYIVFLVVGLVILSIRLFFSPKIWLDLFLKIVPVLTAIIIKMIINKIASQFIFLNRNSKILALDNFRAYNVFLYFNFFFDSFMGFFSAIIRLIKAVIIAMLMLPSNKLNFLFNFLLNLNIRNYFSPLVKYDMNVSYRSAFLTDPNRSLTSNVLDRF